MKRLQVSEEIATGVKKILFGSDLITNQKTDSAVKQNLVHFSDLNFCTPQLEHSFIKAMSKYQQEALQQASLEINFKVSPARSGRGGRDLLVEWHLR